MIYVDADPSEWSKKWGVIPLEKECENCKQEYICDVPVAINGYRGFEMRGHGCPENFKAATFTPIGEESKSWKNLLFGGPCE